MVQAVASLTLLGVTALVLFEAPARAELPEDAERVRKKWSDQGAQVERPAPLFLEHGRVRAVAVPARGTDGCTTVAVLGSRGTEFGVELRSGGEDPPLEKGMLPHLGAAGSREEDDPRTSVAGAAVLSRCGKERAELAQITVEMRSARGALELVVARAPRPVAELREILPERVSGPVAPRGNPGTQGDPAPLADRVARAERRARAEGAEKVSQLVGRASAVGSGQFSVKLAEGCHRLDVMAESPQGMPRRATDVDAEVREAENDRMITRDRAEAADARLDLCVGEAMKVDIPFLGAAGAMAVTLSDALWSLPPALPIHWGSRVRGGLAWALHRRRMPEPKGPPMFESIGVHGATSIPVEIEPGACYLAAVAMIRGESRGVRLAAEVGDRAAHDEVSDRPDSAAVAFCSESERHALLDVATRGNSLWWALSVWHLGSGSGSAARPRSATP